MTFGEYHKLFRIYEDQRCNFLSDKWEFWLTPQTQSSLSDQTGEIKVKRVVGFWVGVMVCREFTEEKRSTEPWAGVTQTFEQFLPYPCMWQLVQAPFIRPGRTTQFNHMPFPLQQWVHRVLPKSSVPTRWPRAAVRLDFPSDRFVKTVRAWRKACSRTGVIFTSPLAHSFPLENNTLWILKSSKCEANNDHPGCHIKGKGCSPEQYCKWAKPLSTMLTRSLSLVSHYKSNSSLHIKPPFDISFHDRSLVQSTFGFQL